MENFIDGSSMFVGFNLYSGKCLLIKQPEILTNLTNNLSLKMLFIYYSSDNTTWLGKKKFVSTRNLFLKFITATVFHSSERFFPLKSRMSLWQSEWLILQEVFYDVENNK